jgi:type IV pilus assembly protein PilC
MTRFARIFLTVLGGLLAFAGVVVLVALSVPGPAVLPVLLLLGFLYGWILFAYFHYRHGRQTELLQLLTTAAESGVPLAPALRAYLGDRPRGTAREFWVAVLLFFVLPGYYWFWHRRHSYDRKVAWVADQLEHGVPLHEALRAAPGVVPRETLVAVAVGEATGNLARCLRGSTTERLATVWLEILPRLVYPLLLLFFLSGVTGFSALYIVPRMERIFREFGEPTPILTRQAFGLFRSLTSQNEFVALALPCAGILAIALLCSSHVRWHLPGIGRISRMAAQGRLLRTLAVLIETGKPVPQAMVLLSDSGAFEPAAAWRLDAARGAVLRGEPLADSLRSQGLLRPTMAPLVQAAERVHNLPWALAELGEFLFTQLVRLLRRMSLFAFTASVLAVGGLVGFIVIALFMPLVELLASLSR